MGFAVPSPWHISLLLTFLSVFSLGSCPKECVSCPDSLFLSQASVLGESSLYGARRGSACGSRAVRRFSCFPSCLTVCCMTHGCLLDGD